MSNSSANLSSVDLISLQLLNASMVANFFWVAVGILSIVNNSLLLLSITCSTRENNNFRHNMLHLAFADLIVGMIQFSIGIKRLYHTFSNLPETSTPKRCSIDMGAVIFGMQISVSQTCCLATDRFMAVTMPIFYRNHLRSGISHAINYSAWLICVFATTIGMIFGVKTDFLVPSCTMASVFTPPFFQGFVFYLAAYVLLTIAEYSAVVYIVKKRLKKAKHTEQGATSVKIELQTQVLDSLKYIVLLFIVTWLLTSVTADFLSLFAPANYSSIIIPYLVGMTGVNSAVNFFVYLLRNSEIRADFYNLFQKNSPVNPLTNNNPTNSRGAILGHFRRHNLSLKSSHQHNSSSVGPNIDGI